MSRLSFPEAIRYLNSLMPRGDTMQARSLRLERIRLLLGMMGSPEKSFKSIHIGGTSGKGSTAYLAASMLHRAGYRTGLHVSPHLQYVGERMQVNGTAIAEPEFAELVAWIAPYLLRVAREHPFGMPTYFETLVAMAFEYFRQQQAEVAVIEVGLGGEFDATNVIRPEVAVLTNVDLDHTAILGNTVEEIAHTKVGIIKPHIRVITGAIQPSVLAIIRERCREHDASLEVAGDDAVITHARSDRTGSHFNLTTLRHRYQNLFLALLGPHQIMNAACAVTAVELLADAGFSVQADAVRAGLAACRVPGRLEIIRTHPLIILDGAHNPAKMRAFVESLSILDLPPTACIFGTRRDKDVRAMIELLTPEVSRFWTTQSTALTDMGGGAGMDAAALAAEIRACDPAKEATGIPVPARALAIALRSLRPDEPLCITGSLYLVGEMRTILMQ